MIVGVLSTGFLTGAIGFLSGGAAICVVIVATRTAAKGISFLMGFL
jgi:hypothetical protein